jgi:hypothetical protein
VELSGNALPFYRHKIFMYSVHGLEWQLYVMYYLILSNKVGFKAVLQLPQFNCIFAILNITNFKLYARLPLLQIFN